MPESLANEVCHVVGEPQNTCLPAGRSNGKMQNAEVSEEKPALAFAIRHSVFCGSSVQPAQLHPAGDLARSPFSPVLELLPAC
jgi:hypothetical protein